MSRVASFFGPSDLGPLFSSLPPELLLEILSYLPLGDIGNLSRANRAFWVQIRGWVSSKSCLYRVPVAFRAFKADDEDLSASPSASDWISWSFRDVLRPSRSFATLLKRLTFGFPSGERIRLAFDLFDMAIGRDSTFAERSEDWFVTLHRFQFSAMLQTFTRGWDVSEYDGVLTALDARFGISAKLERFFSSVRREDVKVALEMDVRLLLRSLVWDFAGNDYGHRAVI